MPEVWQPAIPACDNSGMSEQVPAFAPEPLPEGPIHPGSGRREPLWRKLAAPFVALGLLLSKLKAILLLLPKLKLLTTFGSMLISIAAYQLLFGWPFAVGFVLLLLVHELGHVIQLRREGIEASAPMFIPFLGAVVAAKSMGDDAGAEARVGLAGPVLGSIATLVPLGIYLATGEDFWRALAYVGFFINLFNLLPVLPLDGGRAVQALSSWIWAIGFLLFVGVLIVFPSPVLILIVLLGGFETWRRWKARKSPEAQEYNRIPARTRIAVAVVYLGLVIVLGIGVELTHLERTFSDV
jgi:Zn-dependent protease